MKGSDSVNERSRPETSVSVSGRVIAQAPSSYAGADALNNLISDSIGEVLRDLFGNRAAEAIYDYMERNHLTGRIEIPSHLKEFFQLLENNFGAQSSKVIGRAVAKRIYAKLDWEFYPVAKYEFADYLTGIRARLANLQFRVSRHGSANSTERKGRPA